MSRTDIETLFNSAFPKVHESLTAEGSFSPFGVVMDGEGEVSHLVGDQSSQSLETEQVIELLAEGLRSEADRGEIVAAGICFDVRAVPPGQSDKVDALCAQLEHATGEAMEVFLPYRRASDGEMEYGELFGVPREHQIFRSTNGFPENGGDADD